MKNRLLAIGAMAAIATFALGSALTVLNAYGRGVVKNAEGRSAKFNLNARSSSHGDRHETVGSCVLETGDAEHRGPRLSIRVAELGVDGKIARFAGPAVLSLPRDDGTWLHLTGRGKGETVSNRHPGETGDADVFGVSFEREGSSGFRFGGKVTEGDVTVAKSVSY